MALKLPNDKIVYNLPEQVGVNAENIKYLAEVYKEIDSIPAQYAALKEDYDTNIKGYFDDTMVPAFNGWTTTLDTYLANMSSAALGAIANGTVAGSLSVSGNFTADSIIENMSGYSFNLNAGTYNTYNPKYIGVCKNGNKLTFVLFVEVTPVTNSANYEVVGTFNIPASVASKLFPYSQGGLNNVLDFKPLACKDASNINTTFVNEAYICNKGTNTVYFQIRNYTLTVGTKYLIRIEQTFLLNDSLI